MGEHQEKLNSELLSSTNLTEIADLLNRGANVETVNSNGKLILLIASEYGFYDVVHLLLESGASVNHKDGDENTAGCREISYYKRCRCESHGYLWKECTDGSS